MMALWKCILAFVVFLFCQKAVCGGGYDFGCIWTPIGVEGGIWCNDKITPINTKGFDQIKCPIVRLNILMEIIWLTKNISNLATRHNPIYQDWEWVINWNVLVNNFS